MAYGLTSDDDPLYKTSTEARSQLPVYGGVNEEDLPTQPRMAIPQLPPSLPAPTADRAKWLAAQGYTSIPLGPATTPKPGAVSASNQKWIDQGYDVIPLHPPVSQEQPGEFAGGFQQQWLGTKGSAYGLAGALGRTAGIEGLQKFGEEGAAAVEEQRQAVETPSGSLSDVWEGKEGATWGGFGKNIAGATLEVLTEGIATSLAAAAAGSVIPGFGTVAGGATGFVAGTMNAVARNAVFRGLMSKALTFEGKRVAEQVAKQGLKEITEDQIKDQAARNVLKYATIGASISGGKNTGVEIGSIYNDAVEESEKTGKPIDMAKVYAYGAGAGAAEMVGELTGIGRFLKVGKGGTRISNAMRGLLSQSLTEGGTEGLQTILERIGAGQNEWGNVLTDPNARRDIIDSIGMGMGMGGLIGGVGGATQKGTRAIARDEAAAKAKAGEQDVTEEEIEPVTPGSRRGLYLPAPAAAAPVGAAGGQMGGLTLTTPTEGVSPTVADERAATLYAARDAETKRLDTLRGHDNGDTTVARQDVDAAISEIANATQSARDDGKTAPPVTAPAGSTAPEPLSDIKAQIEALKDPKNPKNAMFIAKGSPMPGKGEWPKGVQRIHNDDGVYLTNNPEKLALVSGRKTLTDTERASFLGIPQGKQETLATTVAPVAAVSKDAKGNVVSSVVTSPTGPNVAATAAQTPAGGSTTIQPVNAALNERQQKVDEEQSKPPPVSQDIIDKANDLDLTWDSLPEETRRLAAIAVGKRREAIADGKNRGAESAAVRAENKAAKALIGLLPKNVTPQDALNWHGHLGAYGALHEWEQRQNATETVEPTAPVTPQAPAATEPPVVTEAPGATKAKAASKKLEAIKAGWAAAKDVFKKFYYKNRQHLTDDLFSGAATTNPAFNAVAEQAKGLQAHGMAKTTVAKAIDTLFDLFTNGIDTSTEGGKRGHLDSAPLVKAAGEIGLQGATASGEAYRDGPFILLAKAGTILDNINNIAAVLVNQAIVDEHPEIITHLQAALPNVMVKSYADVAEAVAHAQQTGGTDAVTPGKESEGGVAEHQDRNAPREAPAAGGGNRAAEGGGATQAGTEGGEGKGRGKRKVNAPIATEPTMSIAGKDENGEASTLKVWVADDKILRAELHSADGGTLLVSTKSKDTLHNVLQRVEDEFTPAGAKVTETESEAPVETAGERLKRQLKEKEERDAERDKSLKALRRSVRQIKGKAEARAISRDVPPNQREAFVNEHLVPATGIEHSLTFVDTPERYKAMAERLGELLDQDIQFFSPTGRELDGIDGFKVPGDPDTVYVNVNARKPGAFLFGHEIGHNIEETHPQLWNAFKEVVIGLTNKREFQKYQHGLKRMLEREAEAQGESRPTLSVIGAVAKNENASDAIGTAFMDPKFWDLLYDSVEKQHRPLVLRIAKEVAAALKNMMQMLRDFALGKDKSKAGAGIGSPGYAMYDDLRELHRAVRTLLVKYRGLGPETLTQDQLVAEAAEHYDVSMEPDEGMDQRPWAKLSKQGRKFWVEAYEDFRNGDMTAAQITEQFEKINEQEARNVRIEGGNAAVARSTAYKTAETMWDEKMATASDPDFEDLPNDHKNYFIREVYDSGRGKEGASPTKAYDKIKGWLAEAETKGTAEERRLAGIERERVKTAAKEAKATEKAEKAAAAEKARLKAIAALVKKEKPAIVARLKNLTPHEQRVVAQSFGATSMTDKILHYLTEKVEDVLLDPKVKLRDLKPAELRPVIRRIIGGMKFSAADAGIMVGEKAEQQMSLAEGVKAIDAMTQEERDNTEVGDMPGGGAAYDLWEAGTLLPNPSDKMKRLTEKNSFSLQKDYHAVANVDGTLYAISKFEDPDATGEEVDKHGDPKEFVYAYTRLDQPNAKAVQTDTTDQADLIADIKASQRVKMSRAAAGFVGPFTDTAAIAAATQRRSTDTPEFKAWFGQSKVVDRNGEPLRLFHGTTHDIEAFDPKRGNVDGDFGRGIYATSNAEDASVNYASEAGPDLVNRIEALAEQYMDHDAEDTKAAWNEAMETARKELVGPGPNIIPVYMSLENPVVMGGDTETYIDGDSKEANRFVKSIQKSLEVSSTNQNFISDNMSRLYDLQMEGGKASEFIAAARQATQYEQDDATGNLVSSELVRKALQDAGFDGVIDRTVSKKWGADSGRGNVMKGVTRYTTHYIAFKPTQLKSAISNTGAYSKTDKRIRYSRRSDAEAAAQREQEEKAITSATRHLTDSEVVRLYKKDGKLTKVALNLVRNLSLMPNPTEMAAVAYAGRAKRGWYANSVRAIQEVFGPDGPRFALLLSAMSPQTSVETNLTNALTTWRDWVRAGRPTDKESIEGILGGAVQKSAIQNRPTESLKKLAGKMGLNKTGGRKALVARLQEFQSASPENAALIDRNSVLDAWVNNSVRALSSPDPSRVVLSGPKVNSFYQNLTGDLNEVTNDAWMAAYALVNQELFAGGLNKAGTEPGKGMGYLAMNAKAREAAAILTKRTGDHWTPAEVQETIWSWAKTLYELQEKKGETRDALALLKDKALTDDMIRATPDFRSLFSDDTESYQALLREAGLDAGIRRLDESNARRLEGQENAGAVAGSTEEAQPFAQRTQERFERQAAKRLATLYANRLRDKTSKRQRDREASGIKDARKARVQFSRNNLLNPVEVYALRGKKIVGMASFNVPNQTWMVYRGIQDGDIRDDYTEQPAANTADAMDALRGPGVRLVRRKESPLMEGQRDEWGRGPDALWDIDTTPTKASNRFTKTVDAVLSKTGLKGKGPEVRRNLIRLAQDSYIDLKALQEDITRKGGVIDGSRNVYQKITLFSGATGHALDTFRTKFVEPLEKHIESALKKGATMADFDKFLVAEHAEERNKMIEQRTGGKKLDGSGITTAEADARLRHYRAAPYAAELQAMSRIADNISTFKVNLMESSGLIDHDTAEGLRSYQHYRPLKNTDIDDSGEITGGMGMGVGHGFTGKATLLHHALGRDEEATHTISHMLLDAEAKIIRAGKNEVAVSLAKMAERFADPKFWTVNHMKAVKVFNPETGTIRYQPSNDLTNPNIVMAYVNGQPVKIDLKDDSFAQAITNSQAKGSGVMLEFFRRWNKYLAMMMTSLNPEWGIVNAARDLQNAYFNIASDSRLPPGMGKKVLAEILALKGHKDIFKAITDPNVQNGLGKWYTELAEQGGITKFFGLETLKDRADKLKNLENRLLHKGFKGKVAELFRKSHAEKVVDFLEDANATVEAVPRVAAYKVLVDAGWSKADAADYAKNLTVNFNRKGSQQAMSSLYLFFNPAVQGTARLYEAIKTPQGKAIAGSLFALGAIASLTGNSAGDDDKNGIPDYQQLSDWERSTNIILWPHGPKVPLPYGWNAFYAMGNYVMDSFFGRSPLSASWAGFKASQNAFNPIGGADSKTMLGWLGKQAVPTVADPALEFLMNENRFGSQIRRVQDTRFGPKMPESQMGGMQASWLAKKGTAALNALTGGSAAKVGAVDLNPDSVDFFFGSILPGVPSTAFRAGSTLASIGAGEETELRQLPFARRVWTEPSKGRIFEELQSAKTEISQYLNIQKNGDAADRAELAKEHPGWAGVAATFTAYGKQVGDLQKRKAAIIDGKVKVADVATEKNKLDQKILDLNNRMLRTYTTVSAKW